MCSLGNPPAIPFCILGLCHLVAKYTKLFGHDRAYSSLRAVTLKIGVPIDIDPDSLQYLLQRASMMQHLLYTLKVADSLTLIWAISEVVYSFWKL